MDYRTCAAFHLRHEVALFHWCERLRPLTRAKPRMPLTAG